MPPYDDKTSQQQLDSRIEELRDVLLKQDVLENRLNPIINQILTNEVEEIRQLLLEPDVLVNRITPIIADVVLSEVEEIRQLLLEPDVLVDRITPVIAQVLAREIEQSKDDIAKAIAPVLGEALRRQIYQAREDIIDALYPVIGQTVNKAVTQSMRELARTVDSRVRQRIVGTSFLRRWQAKLQGVSEEEYRLRAALPFTIEELFLIQRQSGLLIQHLSTQEETLTDRDLISGMLTAIRDFAREMFGQGGELGSIEYESREIILVAGGAAYLAAVINGIEPTGFREDMHNTLSAIHDQQYDQLKNFDGSDENIIKQAAQQLNTLFYKYAPSEDQKPLTKSQRFILTSLALLFIIPPFLLCGSWVWRVESSLAALAHPSPTPTPTVTPTPTFTPTPTPTVTFTPTPTPTPTMTPTPTETALPTMTFTPSPTASPTPTDTPTPTPPPFSGVMIGSVYLRDAPSLDSPRAGPAAPLGAKIEILAQYDNWYRIRGVFRDTPDVEVVGWVLAEWVTLIKPVPPELITPTTSPTP